RDPGLPPLLLHLLSRSNQGVDQLDCSPNVGIVLRGRAKKLAAKLLQAPLLETVQVAAAPRFRLEPVAARAKKVDRPGQSRAQEPPDAKPAHVSISPVAEESQRGMPRDVDQPVEQGRRREAGGIDDKLTPRSETLRPACLKDIGEKGELIFHRGDALGSRVSNPLR